MRPGKERLGRCLTAAVLGYFGGGLPVVYLLGRLAGVDLRRFGSGNVGSHNLSAAAGPAGGLAGWLSDAAKGSLAVLLSRRLRQDETVAGWALVAAIAGQCWPPFLGWSGGRGVATLVGGMLALTPRLAPWPLGLIAAVAGLRPLVRAAGPISYRLHSSAVPFGVLVGALAWPLACRRADSRSHTTTAVAAASLLILRRITANGWRNGPGSRTRLLSRALLDRDHW
jgi:acyl-phosphate glycerol 3-phosphate acyltransferase